MHTVVIGRKEKVRIKEMPELGVVVAKVDTGAYTNTLHCSYLEERQHKDGSSTLYYSPFSDKRKIYETRQYNKKKVTSSNGMSEYRFVIETHIQLGDTILPGLTSLSDRTTMRSPMLLGRRFLKQHGIIVNVVESFTICA